MRTDLVKGLPVAVSDFAEGVASTKTLATKVPGITRGGDISGTHLITYMEASYRDLARVLGEPNSEGDGYKVSTEWALTFKGETFTLYDCSDRRRRSVEEFRARDSYSWHVGGKGDEKDSVVLEFLDVIKAAVGDGER